MLFGAYPNSLRTSANLLVPVEAPAVVYLGHEALDSVAGRMNRIGTSDHFREYRLETLRLPGAMRAMLDMPTRNKSLTVKLGPPQVEEGTVKLPIINEDAKETLDAETETLKALGAEAAGAEVVVGTMDYEPSEYTLGRLADIVDGWPNVTLKVVQLVQAMR